jgi:hypothetical protein
MKRLTSPLFTILTLTAFLAGWISQGVHIAHPERLGAFPLVRPQVDRVAVGPRKNCRAHMAQHPIDPSQRLTKSICIVIGRWDSGMNTSWLNVAIVTLCKA